MRADRGVGIVLELANQSSGLKLLQWTKELPSASAGDPLGLSLRVSARLANELLYCVTSITPRARYYAFFPWAFQDYNDHEHASRTDRGRVKGILSRERAMVLGAVIHHEGHACFGGGLGGSDEAEKLLKATRRSSYDLSRWKHLSAAEGQFGAAYKGSLINLGLFKTSEGNVADDADEQTAELSEEAQAIEVRELSTLGKRLADAFAKSVRNTGYIKDRWTLRDKVDTKVLQEFGSAAGLCEISKKRSADRDVLRDVFFSRCDELSASSHQRRRASLTFMLECVRHAHAAGSSLTSDRFGDICYFGSLRVEGKKSQKCVAVAADARLTDIAQRWCIYQAHSFLAVALQSFLVACVRILRDRRGGITEEALLSTLNGSALAGRFREVTGTDMPETFFELTPRQTLVTCGIPLSSHPAAMLHAARLDAPLSERRLEEYLLDGEANDNAGIAFAAIMLFQVLLRWAILTPESTQNWYRQQVYDPYSDVSLVTVADFLKAEFNGSWIDQPNRDVLRRIIWRFVIRQHQSMSYERGFGGTAPLFQLDGTTVIGTSTEYTNPRSPHPRFSRALQILDDLGFIEDDGEVGYRLTGDGETWVCDELARLKP